MENPGIAALITAASWEATLALSDTERWKMEASVHTLSQALSMTPTIHQQPKGSGSLRISQWARDRHFPRK
jgi:hypothetical protein